MTKAELEELRCAWGRYVKFDDRIKGLVAKPCWFGEDAHFEREGYTKAGAYLPYGPCSGWIEGAHWIKQQTVKQLVGATLLYGGLDEWDLTAGECKEIIELALWDPRNGVPACERHHRIFDSQRVPLPSEQIVIWRHQVPAHVEEFALDWGLENELDRKHDTIGGGI